LRGVYGCLFFEPLLLFDKNGWDGIGTEKGSWWSSGIDQSITTRTHWSLRILKVYPGMGMDTGLANEGTNTSKVHIYLPSTHTWIWDTYTYTYMSLKWLVHLIFFSLLLSSWRVVRCVELTIQVMHTERCGEKEGDLLV